MKTCLCLLFTVCTLTVFSQTYQVHTGHEVKLKKGTESMDILSADAGGVFFTETNRFGDGKLIRFDNSYKEVFEKEYHKDLKDRGFNGLQMIDNEIIILATDYDRGAKLFTVHAATINKQTGQLNGELKSIGQYTEEKRRDKYQIAARPVNNGKNVMVATNISGKDRQQIGISLLDKNLNKKSATIIQLNFEEEEFDLEDVFYTSDDKIVLLGRQYEYALTGKRKKKAWIFKQYKLLIYSAKGKRENELVLDTEDRFLIGGKLVEQPQGGLLLAGFYSNTSAKKNLSGFFISKINSSEGTLTLHSFKEVNSGMIGEVYENEEVADKKDKKDKEEGNDDDFSANFQIRTVDVSPITGDIVITGEVFNYQVTSTDLYTPGRNGMPGNTTTTYHHNYYNQEMLVIKANKEGNIQWVNMLPKRQQERLSSRKWLFYRRPDYNSFFANTKGMPYYSSYSTHIAGNTLYLLMNDHKKNNSLPAYRNSIKRIFNFPKESVLYGVTVNLQNGEMQKKNIGDNSKQTIYMPRYSYFTGNTVYIPSMDEKMIGKTDFRINKITINP